MKKNTVNLLLAAGTTLALVVLSDFVLQRHFHVPSRYLKEIVRFDRSLKPPKRLKPNLNVDIAGAYNEFCFRLKTDVDGFRLSANPADASEPRLVFLGDSQTAGVGVNDAETYPSLVAARLNARVLNTACFGYNSFEELDIYGAISEKQRTSQVVMGFFAGNDPYENYRFLQGGAGGKSVRGSFKSYLVENSALYNLAMRLRRYDWINKLLVQTRLVNDRAPGELRAFLKNDAVAANFWSATERALLEIKNKSAQHSAALLILLVPDRFQVDGPYWDLWVSKYSLNAGHYDLDGPNRRMRAFCETHRIDFLDPTDALRKAQASGPRVYWNIDNHLNKAGNDVIADALTAFLTGKSAA